MNQIQQQAALQAMTEWLRHPQELGRPPAQIECAGEFDRYGLHYYIFKYKRTILDSQWLLGVCGGYEPGSTDHCGHVFSEMEPYTEASAQEDAIALVEQVCAYWQEEAEAAEEEKENAGTMLAFVLLEEASFDREAFLQELRDTWQVEDEDDEEDEDEDEEDEEDSPGPEDEDLETVLLTCQGTTLAVSLIPGPIPEEEIVYHAQRNYMWPEAADTVERHQAHLLVAALRQPGEETSPLDNGAMLVKAVAACCRQKGVLGVYANGVVYQPEFYTDFAEMMKEDLLPLFNLVWFGLYQDEKGRFSGYTEGLRALGYDEMEVLETDVQPKELREFLMNITAYVLEEDVILEDGETIGFSAQEKLPITKSRGVALEGETLKIGWPQPKKRSSSIGKSKKKQEKER